MQGLQHDPHEGRQGAPRGRLAPPLAEPAPLTTRQQVDRLEAKAIEGATTATAKTTRKPRTAEQKAKDAEGARRRRAARKAEA